MDDGTSPLFIASEQGHTGIVSLLLKANANPDSQMDNGASPLFVLAFRRRDTMSV